MVSFRMTNEAMREAIAKAVGAPAPHWYCPTCQMKLDGRRVSFTENCDTCHTPAAWIPSPNYPADLNAIYKVAVTLPFSQRRAYRKKLCWVMGQYEGLVVEPIEAIDATAAQRAEAFCRAVGCGCGCGRTIWECSESKAKEGVK